MPFIRGRYYINPTAGEAVEKAREAEEALAALEKDRSDSDESRADDYEWTPGSPDDGKAPIHRVEIEAASLVPAHTGEVAHGFVARIHRASYAPAQGGGDGTAYSVTSGSRLEPTEYASSKPETRAFSSHSDLVDFLRRELEKDGARSRSKSVR